MQVMWLWNRKGWWCKWLDMILRMKNTFSPAHHKFKYLVHTLHTTARDRLTMGSGRVVPWTERAKSTRQHPYCDRWFVSLWWIDFLRDRLPNVAANLTLWLWEVFVKVITTATTSTKTATKSKRVERASNFHTSSCAFSVTLSNLVLLL